MNHSIDVRKLYSNLLLCNKDYASCYFIMLISLEESEEVLDENSFNCGYCQKHFVNCNRDILPNILGKNTDKEERKEIFLKALIKKFPWLLLEEEF